MSDEATPLRLPDHLPYPIRITRLNAKRGAEVQRGSRLLEYSFTSATARRAIDAAAAKGQISNLKENDMVGSWESPVEGTVDRWMGGIEVGSDITARMAREPIVHVEQPCSHPVQLHGMCGVCGKELAENDYLTRPSADEAQPGPSRFPGSYEMGHDALGVTVSHSFLQTDNQEAERLDDQNRTNLLATRKLSLIVDLDQTIIHTTVDPTVGEWINEINAEHRKGEEGSNPNEEALKDVASFQLEDERPPGWAKAPDRTYYTKPRPGLPQFMEEMSRLYEMHVYTMGTRSYADAIVKAVDPEGKYFGGRILSRDESGSLNAKSLQRLFPTDQSMVVIIDDRSDVWSDVPNLVKVVPYEFFLGAGDINSSFLPPVNKDGAPAKPKGLSTSSNLSSPPPAADADGSGVSEEDNMTLKAKMLDKLSEERPLQKMQEEMDKQAAEIATDGNSAVALGAAGTPAANEEANKVEDEAAEAKAGDEAPDAEDKAAPETTTPPSSPPPKRRPLLRAEDGELPRISSILQRIHRKFYLAYDGWDRTEDEEMPDDCDAPFIITEMKSQVLEGCALVFSGIIPINQRPETSHYWKLAEAFGALSSNVITKQTTHCVAATPGTAKVNQAIKSGLHLVYPDWLTKSAALWRRQDEREFAMLPPSTIPVAEPNRSRVETPSAAEPGPAAVSDRNGSAVMAVKREEGPSDGRGEDDPMGQGDEPDAPVDDADADDDPLDAVDRGLAEAAAGDDDWDEWMKAELGEGWEDDASERGSRRASVSPTPSAPDTPRKRVRYADQEDLPLASFRQPPSRGNSGDDWSGDDGTGSPPRKRKTPILLGPPPEREGDANTNRIELSDKAKAKIAAQIEASQETEGSEFGGSSVNGDASEAEEDEDEFAKLLAESMAED